MRMKNENDTYAAAGAAACAAAPGFTTVFTVVSQDAAAAAASVSILFSFFISHLSFAFLAASFLLTMRISDHVEHNPIPAAPDSTQAATREHEAGSVQAAVYSQHLETVRHTPQALDRTHVPRQQFAPVCAGGQGSARFRVAQLDKGQLAVLDDPLLV